ncbi:MAG: DNA/RNA non-specific endonuclease [Bacteroidales bacterium]|nr:MAG: DNA/RNA non-specific endonuclease [Bacteroidales bacterium]
MTKKFISIFTITILIGFIVYFYVTCKPIPSRSKAKAVNTQVIQSNQEKYQIVKHKYFTLAYSEEHEQPAWVCYTLRNEYVGGSEHRSNNFIPDPLVTSKTADDIDYLKSGYDKGHMLPAADMSWSPEAMKETFYFSNISPQEPSFNRGAWKKLEEKVRDWAVKFDSVKVYVGPVFKNNIKRIGPDSVTVPGYYYKTIVIYFGSTYEGIGFIFPNKKVSDPIVNFAVSIDSVEHYSNLDFYKYLPNSIEEKVESSINLDLWGLSKTK